MKPESILDITETWGGINLLGFQDEEMTATFIQFIVGLYVLPVATASVVAYRKNKRIK